MKVIDLFQAVHGKGRTREGVPVITGYKCALCGALIKLRSELEQHAYSHHAEGPARARRS